MNAGSLEAIVYELRHGTLWTVIDELLHALDEVWEHVPYQIAHLRYRFCYWAHRNDLQEDTQP